MWTSSYFQDLYLKLYRDRLIEPQQTAAEAAMVRRIFPRPDEGPLLDLACGHGRHAIALAKKGYQIAGVDSQAAYLAAAQVEAERQGVSVDWIRADARRQPLASESMAGVYCLFNSWGYLGAEEACREAAAGRRSRPLARAEDPNFDILTDAARVLRPGGRLLLDLPHRPSLLRLVRAQPNLRMSSGDYDIQEKFAYSSEVGRLGELHGLSTRPREAEDRLLPAPLFQDRANRLPPKPSDSNRSGGRAPPRASRWSAIPSA
jgi:SAM-dependent methyltransferase